MTYHVYEVQEEGLLLPFLLRDRIWSAYALSDLEPPYRQNGQFVGALEGHVLRALLLFYRLPGATALHADGERTGVRAALDHWPSLPARLFLLTAEHYLASIAERYHIEDRWPMWRMVLRSSSVVPRSPALPLRPLGDADIPAVRRLYALWGTTSFDPLMLRSGYYVGAFDGPQLVAVAGTHTVCSRFRVAAIGGVFTHPEYRGCGLATAATGAVARKLLADGIEDIVLNVRQDNAPALAAYRRLGFEEYLPYWEGHAALRTASTSAP